MGLGHAQRGRVRARTSSWLVGSRSVVRSRSRVVGGGGGGGGGQWW